MQVKPPCSFTPKEVDDLTYRIQNGGTEVVEVSNKMLRLLSGCLLFGITLTLYITSSEGNNHRFFLLFVIFLMNRIYRIISKNKCWKLVIQPQHLVDSSLEEL